MTIAIKDLALSNNEMAAVAGGLLAFENERNTTIATSEEFSYKKDFFYNDYHRTAAVVSYPWLPVYPVYEGIGVVS